MYDYILQKQRVGAENMVSRSKMLKKWLRTSPLDTITEEGNALYIIRWSRIP